MSEERLRVLLLDDEESLREPLKKYLEWNFGYQVDAASNGDEALKLVDVAQGQYDVALIDEVLASPSDGIEVMREIKRRYADVECIIFTGWDTGSWQRALQAGAFRYLKKPFDNNELAMLVRTAAQQVRLRAISRDILSELDLDQVLAGIAAAACSLSLADEAAIVLVDSTSGKLLLYVKTYPAEQQWLRHFKGQSLSKEISRSGRVAAVADIRQDSRSDPKFLESGIRSFIGVPIPGEGGNLGVLYVYSQKPGHFDAWGTVALLQTLAGQAGLAIVNAQAFEQIRAHAGYMDALVRAGQGFTKATKLEDQLTLAWEFVREQLRVSTFFIALYDHQTQSLRFPLAYEEGQAISIPERPLGDNQTKWGITGYVVKTGQELSWLTLEDGQRQCISLSIQSIDVGRPQRPCSCFYLPLRSGGEVFAVISIQSYEPNAFTPILLDAFRALGSQLTVALENARLFDSMLRAKGQLATLNEVTLEIGKEQDQLTLLQTIIQQSMRLLSAEGGAVYRIDPTGEYFIPAATAGLSSGLEGQRIGKSEGLSGVILSTGRPQRVVDYSHWDKRLTILDAQNIANVAGAPILIGNRIVGTLVVHHTHPTTQFDDTSLVLLQQLANHAGLALQKATLLEKLRAIQEVSTTITSSFEFQELLNRACQAVVELFGVEHSGLALFDQDLEWGTVKGEYPTELRTLGVRFPIRGVLAEEELALDKETLVIRDVEQVASELGSVLAILHHFDIRSVAIVPIIYRDRVLGSFSLDAVGHTRQFTPDEVELCRVFAAHVAIAVENAMLFSQLSEAKEWREALLDSAFDAMIAIDQDRKITIFNQRAEEMLGWTAEDMLGQTVSQLHIDRGKAREVFDTVNREGAVSGWKMELKHRDGTPIPTRLSATRIRDSQGRLIGQAGFMRDLRQVNLLEERLRALIQVSQAVTSTLDLDEVLKRVMNLAVTAFPAAQRGTLYLYDEQANVLRLRENTFGYSQSAIEALCLRPSEGIAGWVFQHCQPAVVGNAQQDPRYKRVDHPEVLVHKSMICVPLKVRKQVIGTLSLDNLDIASAFRTDDIDLLSTFADQVAIAIDNARLYQETRQREQLLGALDEVSRRIRAERETSKLLHEIVRLAAQLVDCPTGALFINRAHLGELELTIVYGLPADLVGSRLLRTQGLVGLVARSGESQIIREYSNWPDRETIFESCHARTMIGVPLKRAGEIEAILLVADADDARGLTQTDLEILERFAAQAAIAIQTSWLISQEQRMLGQLQILHQISDYIQAAGNLDKILNIVLTGVTAGYGLGFNRAALFLLDERGEYLMGRMGIGHLEEAEARQDWAKYHSGELDDFHRFLRLLEEGGLPKTPIDERIRRVRIPVTISAADSFAQVMRDMRCTLVAQDELDRLPEDFTVAFAPAFPLVFAPLLARGQPIGLLVADNKFTHFPITPENEEALMTFVNTAAIAIDNAQTYHQAQTGQEQIRSFYKASNALVSLQDPQVLQDIVEQARIAAQAASVSLILIDKAGQVRDLVTTRIDKPHDVTSVIRPNGLSVQVMRTGNPEVIENTSSQRERVNPRVFQNGIAAALCLPVAVQEERLGVMWFHYDEPRRFSTFEIDAAQLYVNQAAVAYDSARRIKELEHMRQAAEALAGAANLQDVLQQIVESAKEVLQADSAAIWSYDDVRDAFIPESSVSSGIPAELWQEFRQVEPQRGWTAHTIMEAEWVGVSDVADAERYEFLGESTRKLLRQIRGRSFQGIVLTVGDEKLGVLYVSYNSRRDFHEREREIARTFGNHAALALKKARLLEQVSKARDAAKLVAEVTVLEDLDSTLDSIVQGTQDALGSNAVTLYTYDQERRKLGYPPVMSGVRFPERVVRLVEVPKDSIVFAMLQRDEPYVTEETTADRLFRGRRFGLEEEIKSCVGIPLRVGDRKVGVMFVNYRSYHHFTADELANIELFANQAAVAIRNAQLYQVERRHTQALNAVQATSAAVSAVLELDILLPIITEKAAAIFDAPATSLMLWNERKEHLVIRSAFGLSEEYRERQRIHRSTVDHIVKQRGLSPHVLDIHHEPIGNADLVRNEQLYTVLSTPLIVGNDLIGVLNIYSRHEPHPFDEGEKELAKIFANHAAIAIQNAHAYEELKRTKGLVGARTALAWMGMASSAWRHASQGKAITIKEEVDSVLAALAQDFLAEDVGRRLAKVKRLASEISDEPITAPLTSEETAESVSINDLLRERVNQLWDNKPYNSVKINLNLNLDDIATVRASSEWLRRAFDILIDNAVEAMVNAPVKRLTVTTERKDGSAEIILGDTGAGIPSDLLPKLFHEQVKKPKGTKGQGVGLLMDQAIIQAYGGEIYVESTGPTGTTMVVRLPLEV